MYHNTTPRTLSRLEITSARLRSQIACVDWVSEYIAQTKGPVFELGLGRGRTYDHLRKRMPDRIIYAFDREIVPIEDCCPPLEYTVKGELSETLPKYAKQFAGKVILANSDVGSYGKQHNDYMLDLISQYLPPAIAPGGFVLSDLPLRMDGFAEQPLPADAVNGHYRIFRKIG